MNLPISVEWAPFIKAVGVTDAKLIEAADKVNTDFLSQQPGFINRELVKKTDTEFADILHWQTKADALAASDKIQNCVPCA